MGNSLSLQKKRMELEKTIVILKEKLAEQKSINNQLRRNANTYEKELKDERMKNKTQVEKIKEIKESLYKLLELGKNEFNEINNKIDEILNI